MAHPFILNIHTHIHTYIRTFIHSYIYTYIYMYLNTHNVCIYIYIYIYIILAQTYLQKNATVKFLRGVVAKPWYFTVLAGSPQKNQLPMLQEPLLVSYPCGK